MRQAWHEGANHVSQVISIQHRVRSMRTGFGDTSSERLRDKHAGPDTNTRVNLRTQAMLSTAGLF